MTLEQEKKELMDLLAKHKVELGGRTPFGLLEMTSKLPEDDRKTILYNSYFSESLLYNKNTWMQL